MNDFVGNVKEEDKRPLYFQGEAICVKDVMSGGLIHVIITKEKN